MKKTLPLSAAICFFILIFSSACFAAFPYQGNWDYAGTRRDGVARSGHINFLDNGKFMWTIVDADHQSDGSDTGTWMSSGSTLTLNFGAKVWSGPISGSSNAFRFTTSHGSYNFTRSHIISSIFTTGSATFDPSTYIIHIPCVAVDTNHYWIDLQIASIEPLTIKISSFGVAAGSAVRSTLNLKTLTLNVPRLFINGRSYNLSLQWNQSGFFNLTGFGDNGNSYGEDGECFVACKYDDPLRCAVSCDTLFGGAYALSVGDYNNVLLGPTSWNACADRMRDLGQQGW
jgi:hypothetical protein